MYKIKSQVAYHFTKQANIFSAVLLHILNQHGTSIKTCYLLLYIFFWVFPRRGNTQKKIYNI